ncbi:MAG: hypothetical protein HY958_08005 [Bacteroidia bacterium]|nr:hypothetical protein [Bacteroidia bacterium]
MTKFGSGCLLLILSGLIYSSAFSQTGQKMVEYTPDFKFKEGIFISFDQVKLNKPITKTRIVTKIGAGDFEYFVKVLSEENLTYFDDYGIQKIIKVNDIWGYCRKGMLFINWQGEFNRVPVIGGISYFAALVSVPGSRFPDPFDPFYPTVGTTDNRQEDMRQFLIDYETGQVLDFSYDNVAQLLKPDNELYEEYKALKKRKKKQLTFIYIRKFNEKHPVSFPVN